MRKLQLLILCILITVLIAGCTGDGRGSQSVIAGKLIFNQDQITTVKVVNGSIEEKVVVLNNSDIPMLLSKIKEIPVKKLTKDQDDKFMSGRIVEETKMNIYFYEENNFNNTIIGEFFIWPDGYIYVVDVNSMKENQRTISYLSESKYPEIYEWINERYDE
jgi:ABC-type Fe3+-hydroxamate transport system substrate-binding protein